ncbi:hypothetical protein ACA910_005758 [Epithemia clementina (nom. ined.)]
MADNVTGTTPLPISWDLGAVGNAGAIPVRVWFDVDSVVQQAQQPQTQQFANFDAKANEDCINGNMLAVNQRFVVYSVKNGLIRVLRRQGSMRTLLRANVDSVVTDIRFFQDGDLLATVASNILKSSIIIWRIFEQPPEVGSEILLELSSTKMKMSRVFWHPFNVHVFCLLHTNVQGSVVASLVDTNALRRQPPNEKCHHPTSSFDEEFLNTKSILTVQSSAPGGQPCSVMTDLAWSPRDCRYLLTCHKGGEIILWDLQNITTRLDGTRGPAQVRILQETKDEILTRCFFLPHDDQILFGKSNGGRLTPCFATATNKNSTVTLWSPFLDSSSPAPSKLQVLSLERPSPSYLLDVVSGIPAPDGSPMSSFIVMADRHSGNILAFHLQAQWDPPGTGGNNEIVSAAKRSLLVGANYVVPFKTRYPIFSFNVQCEHTTDIAEEELVDQGGLIFDTRLYSYQSKLVQCLTLTSYMCLPPDAPWSNATPGVRVERLFPKNDMISPITPAQIDRDQAEGDEGVEVDNNIQYDEDYDYDGENDDEDDDDEEEDNGQTDSAPAEAVSGNNPFANWLGAIAAKAADNTVVAPPMPPPPPHIPQTPVPKLSPTSSVPAVASATAGPKTYAVPVVTAPPASDLPAPDGEPLAFLSPSDFVANGPISEKKPEPSPEKKQTSSSNTNDSSNKKTGKPGKKSNKKNAPANDSNVTILKRDAAPRSPPRPAVHNMPDIAHEIRQAVKEEMKNSVIPVLKSTIKEALSASIIRPLQTSIDQLLKQGVTVDHDTLSASLAGSLDPPLRAAFADSMRNVFIPTLESVTGQILEKLSENLASSAAETNGNANKDISAMSSQLSTMTELVAELTREVQALRDIQNRQVPAAPQPVQRPQPAVNNIEATKAEIRRLLAEKNFEAAFTKAVSASTAELAVFCCAHADVTEVLAMQKAQLSQPIILCLMQQLGTVVQSGRNTNLQVELEWLQDLALSLDPKDHQIQQHVPRVLQQLVLSINNRMSSGDPNLRRPLQRLLSIIRGIPLS